MKDTFDTYYLQIYDLEMKRIQMDKRIEEIANKNEYIERVAKLRCFKGIDYLTALSFIVEIGDFNRFKTSGHSRTSYM